MTALPPGADPDAYYAPGWQPPAPPNDGLAVAALVTGIVGVGPVALGLGITSLSRLKRTGRRGRGLAIAGVVLGGLWTIVGAVVTISLVLAVRSALPLPGTITAERSAHVGQLRTGHCLRQLPADGSVDTVTVVPCTTAHAAQVITDYEFTSGAAWPGQTSVDASVAVACQLTADERSAGVRLVTWAPTRESWLFGDRTGLCLATTGGSGSLTGSFLDGTVTLP